MSDSEKRCHDCKKSFALSAFHSGQGVCKMCNHARVKLWRQKNPDKAKEQYRRNKKRRRERAAIKKAEEQMVTKIVE